MQELFSELTTAPDEKHLVVMPICRFKFGEDFRIGKFYFSPDGNYVNKNLRAVKNKELDEERAKGINHFTGQALREIDTSATGFSEQVVSSSPVVYFIVELDWDEFLADDHGGDTERLKQLSALADRALDIVRLNYCRLDLPDTLPGRPGSWFSGNDFLGAQIYSIRHNESYLIAGSAVESVSVVKGVGLEIVPGEEMKIPDSIEGTVGAVARHGLTLLTATMEARDETSKFIRAFTLLDYLSSPYEFRNWTSSKTDIACHYAKTKKQYHELCLRFKELTGNKVEGVELGYRTRIVHQGAFLHQILPDVKDRTQLFRELQGYCGSVLGDMIEHASDSWDQFIAYRQGLKESLGVARP